MNAKTIESVALEAAVGWSIVSEPGDEFAGYLRASLGASRSLELIKTRQVPTLLAAVDTLLVDSQTVVDSERAALEAA